MQYDEFIGEVLEVVSEGVTEGALEDIKDGLPEDEGYDTLFEIAEGEGSPA